MRVGPSLQGPAVWSSDCRSCDPSSCPELVAPQYGAKRKYIRITGNHWFLLIMMLKKVVFVLIRPSYLVMKQTIQKKYLNNIKFNS